MIMQAKENEPEFITQTVNYDKGFEVKQKFIQGTLVVHLVHGKAIYDRDIPHIGKDTKLGNQYVFISFPGGKKVKSKTQKNTSNPVWKQLFKS